MSLLLAMGSMSGCAQVTSGKRIIRIAHAQSEEHPEHIGLLEFKRYIEENLGDKYEVQIYPNELLGAAQRAIEL
ncbi:MAG: TRAP transporter substrate-binding protein, partial [Eubacteriales bacterium]|nr:TRAP transporter substrate-binding protein [Eubacteriales bacterium]